MLASFFDSRFGVSLRILAGNPLFRRFWMDESRLSSHDAVYVCAMLKISECFAIFTFRALHIGQMSERSKETVLKTVEGQPSASSNLALSAFGLIGSSPMGPFRLLGNCVEYEGQRGAVGHADGIHYPSFFRPSAKAWVYWVLLWNRRDSGVRHNRCIQ